MRFYQIQIVQSNYQDKKRNHEYFLFTNSMGLKAINWEVTPLFNAEKKGKKFKNCSIFTKLIVLQAITRELKALLKAH